MTVSATTNRVQYNGDGGTVTFPFTFGIFANTDLHVIKTSVAGVDTTLTLTTHYAVTITSPGDLPSAGSVVMVTAPATGEKLTILTNLPYTQNIDIVDGGSLPASSINEAHDRAVLLIQQLKELLGRSLTLSASSTSSGLTIPNPVALQFMRWNAAAAALENFDISSVGDLAVSDFAKTLLDDLDAAAARLTLGAMASNNFATAAEITTGTEAAKAIAPDQLALTKYNGDWSFWGIKNLRLIDAHAGDATRVIVNPSAYNIPILIGEHWHVMTAAVDVDSVDDLDTGALAAGTDYYVYACTDGTTLSFKVSANATNPTGFDSSHSRKIGGFHTLCAAVGTISGHTLTGYAQKDILPASIWDLKHRAKNLVNVGLVYDSKIQKWVDIYLASGTGASTTSVNGGTISDTRNWMDFVDDGLAVGKRLLTDTEFTSAAAGSNEETNITGDADPGTTSGHVDTAGRRMISNIGCEDMCGVVWQWLQDQSYYYYGATPYYGNLPGGKGSTYTQFAADPGATEVDNSDSGGDVKLFAGGAWSAAAVAGSRSRAAADSRWHAGAALGARFAAEPL